MKYSEIVVGQKSAIKILISKRVVDQFIALSQDTNTVHSGDDGIVHGALIMSYVSALIGTRLPGDGAIWVSSKMTFISPIKVNTLVHIQGEIIRKDDDTRHIMVMISVYDADGTLAVSGSCNIKTSD